MSTDTLQIAHAFDCGPVHVEVAYRTITDVPHISGRAGGDPFRDRFEIRLTDRGVPADAEVLYQSPQPVQFFFSVLRLRKDAAPLDLTSPQIDPHHTGSPTPRKLTFAHAGETQTDETSFFALGTIVPDDEIVPGEYLLRLRSYAMISVGGTEYSSEPVEVPLTVRSLHDP